MSLFRRNARSSIACTSIILNAVFALCASAQATRPVLATDSVRRAHPPKVYRFYTGKTYGSEAAFNPLTEVLNEGYDVLGMRGQNRQIFRRGFEVDARNVLRSVAHFPQTYSNYGWRVVRNEFLPITSTRVPGGGSWLPNYEAHLLGSGMVSRKMTEWYDMHGFDHPAIFAGATMMTAHFLNEVVENNGFSRLNEDATTDLLFFDLGGIALWQTDFMQRAFSGSFQLTNWPGQPSWNPASATLENSGQSFVIRGPIPKMESWRWFYLFGLTGSGGITRVLRGGNALSVGFGLDAVDNPVVDSLTGAKGATLRPKGAIYYDRNGSLLWSLTIGSPNGLRSWLAANVYPGFLGFAGVKPGLWVQLPRRDPLAEHDGKLRLGIVSSWGVGLGAGARR
jgi:hypothetical protein